MHHKYIQSLIASVFISITQIATEVAPASSQSFSVSPMVTIAEARNGQAKGSITVANLGTKILRMRVSAEDFTYDKKDGFKTIDRHELSAVPYLQFSPRELVIPPGVSRSIRVVSILPPSLQNSEYRAVLFLEELEEKNVKNNNGNAVIVSSRVGSVFYINKGINKSDIQATKAIWNNKLSIVLTNKGQQSGYPNVNWQIEKDGKEVAKDTLKGILIQSGNEQEVELKYKGQPVSLSSGSYNLSGQIIDSGKKNVPFSLKINIP
jgi:P pilus assembly chaperone PapD